MPQSEETPLRSLMNGFSRVMNAAANPNSGSSTTPATSRAQRIRVNIPIQVRRQNNNGGTPFLVTPEQVALFFASRRPGNASTSAAGQPRSTSRSINHETPTQSGFDPERFNPYDLTFRETCRELSRCDLDKHVKFVRETILMYSLSIRGFPDCPDEDLMLAVYFFFEDKFKIEATFELCVRFDHHNEKDLVGVILDSIQTVELIINRAAKLKGSRVKVMSNAAFHWILDGFCDD